MRPDLLPHLALAAAQLCFGLFPLFGKLAFEAFEPGAVAGWRVAFGSVVIFGIAWLAHGRRVWPAWRDLPMLQVCALLGVAVNQALYLEGLERATSVNTGLMMMLVPLFTFVIAVCVRQEKFAWRRGLGIAIALGGTAQIVLARGLDLSSSYLVGNLLLIGNTFCYAGYLVASKPLMARYPPIVVLAWVYVLSFWTFVFVTPGVEWVPAEADAAAWRSLALIMLLPTFAAYLLNLYALRYVPASTTAVYVFAQPLIAAVAGTVFLGESVGWDLALAGACIFVGIALVVLRRASAATP